MALTMVQSSNTKKYSALTMGVSMKKFVKNCKQTFFKYDVQHKTKLAQNLQQPRQLHNCQTVEERQNWLNEQLASK